MSKKTTATAAAEDLLGTAPAAATATKVVKKPAKKADAPAAATATKVVKKPAKKADAPAADDLLGTAPAAAPAKTEAAPKAAKVREPISFDEGEREAHEKAIKRIVAKAPIVTRELNKKLTWGEVTGMPGRKLRDVLYEMQRKGAVTLTPGANRAAGMTVALPTPEQAEAFKAKKAELAKRAKKADTPAA